MNDDRTRVEIKYLNEKIDLYHKTVMDVVKPMKAQVEKTTNEVTTLKRDRYWLYTMCLTFCSGALYAILEKLVK